MRLATRVLLCAALLVPLAAAGAAADNDVAAYIELTIARLELIESSWREHDEPPSEEALDELYSAHGTDREAYFCFAGERRDEIEAYLDENPELRDAIESLSAAIRGEIARGEEP